MRFSKTNQPKRKGSKPAPTPKQDPNQIAKQGYEKLGTYDPPRVDFDKRGSDD